MITFGEIKIVKEVKRSDGLLGFDVCNSCEVIWKHDNLDSISEHEVLVLAVVAPLFPYLCLLLGTMRL